MKIHRQNVEIDDLRSAIELLKNEGEIVFTDTEVDCHGELAGVYRHVGAGGN